MAEFEIPDLNVTSVSPMAVGTSGNELPFIPFSEKEDELGFVSFN